MKIVSIVGARPQFIKAAVVSREIRKYHEEIIVHTGQHFDYNMSEVFFEELEIPHPDYNLGVSGGTHGQMTGNMIIEIENVLMQEKPDAVLLYGDTNSTLAGAIATVKLHIPILHVEAGSRVGSLDNPEEVNTIVTDNLSKVLFCCTKSDKEQLEKEGITKNVFLVGDPMYDAFLYYSQKSSKVIEKIKDINGDIVEIPDNFYYMTCHRPENTEDDTKVIEILEAMNSLDYKTIYPVHPRNRNKIIEFSRRYSNIIFSNPVSYLSSVYFTKNAEKIVTDSGGLQREAFFAEKKCVTIFDKVMWKETMIDNRNNLSKAERNDILDKLALPMHIDNSYKPFGEGDASVKIAKIINETYC
ncbi:MAG: UDP-N-acetylglucosamine 2-epimerase (non-hydrolyzing) [Anaerovoracaceae bacterium]|nr:UDP-N-acetylglucosamine 2-epimerase (non-hydrolyzing) [Anaerovoracaceae bacterium]